MADLVKQLQEAVDLKDIPGAVVVAKNSNGTFDYVRAVGHRTLLDGTVKDLEPTDVLSIYSATKLVTAVAVLQCVERGLLSLDEDISRVLPRFATVQVITAMNDDKPQFEKPRKPVTLRHLVTHSSGAMYDQMDPALAQWRAANGGFAAMGAKTVAERCETPLAFQPGTRFGYGTGFDWAGKAVEAVSTKSLEAYFREHIFNPLGIKDASFFPMKNAAMKERYVDLNPEDPHGYGLAPLGGMSSKMDVTDCFGGHGLSMPAVEYIKILQSLLANDGKLLQPATADLLFQPHLEPEAHAFLNGNAAGEMATTLLGAGLPKESPRDHSVGGLLVQQDQAGWFTSGTISWGGAFNSTWFIDRKTDLCGFGAPQMYMRNAPFAPGTGASPTPHRDGAPSWLEMAEQYKQVCREGIYRAYGEWIGHQ